MNIFRLHYSLKGSFKDIILLNFHIATKKKVPLELFSRWINWGWEEINNFPKVTQLKSGETRPQIQMLSPNFMFFYAL